MITFGPVPSRRLGRSLGINNIPYKICTYSCVYCQIGRTVNMTIKRRTFYDPMRVLKDVKIRLEEVHRKGERVDYVTFVPDGEPTLDINIGKTAALIGDLGIPVAIITNSSLLWREDVRQDLYNFDLVSLKLDAVSRDIWRRVNRPHRELSLERILDGILEFRKNYKGKLLTETMLIDGINYEREIRKIADFVRKLSPDRAYIAVPIRPPAESWVRPATEYVVNYAFQELSKVLSSEKVELLISHEGTDFTSVGGDLESELLSITSVHPIREDSLKVLLNKAGADWSFVEKLISDGKLVEIVYNGKKFYMRSFRKK